MLEGKVYEDLEEDAAWAASVLTIPLAAAMSALSYLVLRRFFQRRLRRPRS
jgi:hypothetical protein